MKKVRKVEIQSEQLPDYSGTRELVATENGLFGYSTEIVRKIHALLNLNSESLVCDFGAGGGLLPGIFRESFEISPVCVELDPGLRQRLKELNFSCVEKLEDIGSVFDAIYTSNVLEHIEDDFRALVSLRNHLKPEGRLAIYVPAHQFLYSEMDRMVGHVRRYSMKELKRVVSRAGFKIEYAKYDDFLGFFVSLLLKILGYNREVIGSERSLKIYDRVVYPVSKILDMVGMRHILGKNILLVCSIQKVLGSAPEDQAK